MQKPGQHRAFPVNLEVGASRGENDQVDRAVAADLIGDMDTLVRLDVLRGWEVRHRHQVCRNDQSGARETPQQVSAYSKWIRTLRTPMMRSGRVPRETIFACRSLAICA